MLACLGSTVSGDVLASLGIGDCMPTADRGLGRLLDEGAAQSNSMLGTTDKVVQADGAYPGNPRRWDSDRAGQDHIDLDGTGWGSHASGPGCSLQALHDRLNVGGGADTDGAGVPVGGRSSDDDPRWVSHTVGGGGGVHDGGGDMHASGGHCRG